MRALEVHLKTIDVLIAFNLMHEFTGMRSCTSHTQEIIRTITLLGNAE